ncbi:MAG: glycosyl hydrolase family 5, partial [Cytophagales bacterium]|nr:glycosyl hydrolase family 5 [Cytophagales bacterium]
MKKLQRLALLLLLFAGASPHLFATKLAEVRVLDRDYIMVIFKDGDVTFVNDVQQVVRYGTALNTTNAGLPVNWSLVSSGDPNYGTSRNPTNCYRKSKLNGMAQMEWLTTVNDYRYEHTMEHVMFLKLPFSMVQGRTYTLTINGNTNTDVTSRTFTYDIFNSRSEALHVNVVGYYPSTGVKAADLYAWLGDGGARDYTAFQGRKVYLHNVATGVATEVGTVTYWKASAGEAQGYNFTQSAVWNVDFTSFTGTGTYRLAVEGVGCSDDFKIDNSVYLDPYKVSVRGFYYMRIGQNNNANLVPAARTPLYIPNVSPSTTKVYLTTMQPYHPNWTTFAGGDVWDAKDEWAPYVKPGSPQNPNAWGGHSDAADWDRHLGHVSIIYDLLLPYFLSKGKLSDDNLGIAES